ncbi:hypothetical protein MYP_2357 [Sporocytophaga myxococcoides]|uniref:Uncharacterized protein n=1 Tax=Sporocytophaga myxococcoides TaxID=153721 RepID=A0A098LF97_9BACT|nr:hypothetical protein [Sporocytophaga myxococcoides]GAL85129.1 hypothetical protein MYP_2357 [Sporocytophaga myxococcoides]
MKYTKVYWGRFLVYLSIVLFFVSFFLPAFTLMDEGSLETIQGFSAALLGVFLGILALLSADKNSLYVITLLSAWFANPLYVFLVIVKLKKQRLRWINWGPSLLAFSFIFWGTMRDAAHLEEGDMKLQIGYFVWLCSIMLISYSFHFPNPVKAKIGPKIGERVNKKVRYKQLPSADIRRMQKLRRR